MYTDDSDLVAVLAHTGHFKLKGAAPKSPLLVSLPGLRRGRLRVHGQGACLVGLEEDELGVGLGRRHALPRLRFLGHISQLPLQVDKLLLRGSTCLLGLFSGCSIRLTLVPAPIPVALHVLETSLERAVLLFRRGELPLQRRDALVGGLEVTLQSFVLGLP